MPSISPFFPAGTYILTPAGYRRIESILSGEQIISGEGTGCIVAHTGSTISKTGILKISNRPDLRCTQNHHVMCVFPEKGETRWVEVGKASGALAVPFEAKYQAMPELPENLCFANEADFLELAGWYLANGCLVNFGKKMLSIYLGLSDAFQQRFQTIVPYHFDSSLFGELHIFIDKPDWTEWLCEQFGDYGQKKIPYWCYRHPLRACLLGGFVEALRAAGRLEENQGQCRFSTMDESLALGLADILGDSASLGVQDMPLEDDPDETSKVFVLEITPVQERAGKSCLIQAYDAGTYPDGVVYGLAIIDGDSVVTGGHVHAWYM